MKQLLLARHAKSTWKEKDMADIDRPLKMSGISDAYKMASSFKKHLCVPSHIITSPANRALHTTSIYARALQLDFSSVEISSELYLPSLTQLLDYTCKIDNNLNNVLLVGHNPSFSEFAQYLLDEPYIEMPTAGIIGIELNIGNWSEINNGIGSLLFFDSP